MSRHAQHHEISGISVHALADLSGASTVTIRRDLADLEGQGLLRRVHGGAVTVDRRGSPHPYAVRALENSSAKTAIASHVASLIGDGTSVVLDNGSTVTSVARALSGRPITALCLSLHAAVELGGGDATAVIVPGGRIAPGGLSADAASSIATLDNFRADTAVIGACSAAPSAGLTVTASEDAMVKRAILACSARVILAATGDKLARTSSFRFGQVEDLDDLVTTQDAPEQALDEFHAAGVHIHFAR
ncbi:DeoR/GlpR family DNA-binding transcription regulator [Austwickia chelonae]|uniref:DeoR/GlpR family DNA-binding transcription regulator n=1 Tax=Austwickia chelonae TaxID=100225 RepID=UPI000E24BE1D|nr:DeoR/GlpR family DNA-binding transcription regulator [Austwickia chelonae]